MSYTARHLAHTRDNTVIVRKQKPLRHSLEFMLVASIWLVIALFIFLSMRADFLTTTQWVSVVRGLGFPARGLENSVDVFFMVLGCSIAPILLNLVSRMKDIEFAPRPYFRGDWW